MLDDFKKFLMRGNVVDLAVAVVIGAAFGAVVTSFVEGIITPIIGVFGERDFSQYTIKLKEGDPEDIVLRWGAVLTAILNFVVIAAAIFLVVVKPLNTLAERRKRGETAPEDTPVPSDEALLLAEIRDLLATRNG